MSTQRGSRRLAGSLLGEGTLHLEGALSGGIGTRNLWITVT